MKRPPKTIDEYLAPLSDDQRAALEKLRREIRAAAPGVEEYIAYQIPAFKLAGRLLVAFGAAKNHCAFYPGAHPIAALADELRGYATSKGTIRFAPESPLPAALVKKLVRARIAERAGGRSPAAGGATGRPPRRASARQRTAAQASVAGDVEVFLRALDHPLVEEMRAVRALILGASPAISEGIKWNAPSFRAGEWFATFNFRRPDFFQVILHLGARVRGDRTAGVAIDDPAGLLEWLAGDRAAVKFRDMAQVDARAAALVAIVRQWIARRR